MVDETESTEDEVFVQEPRAPRRSEPDGLNPFCRGLGVRLSSPEDFASIQLSDPRVKLALQESGKATEAELQEMARALGDDAPSETDKLRRECDQAELAVLERATERLKGEMTDGLDLSDFTTELLRQRGFLKGGGE